MKAFLSLALFLAFLLCPAACADGVRSGLSLAAHQALPALFPFFAASALFVRTGLSHLLARFAARPLAWLYGLPPAAAPILILGLTGGYPVGAATAAAALEQQLLTPEQAARANAFCNCASPGFCIGLVGLGVFGSARTGAVLYGVHALSALLTGLLVARAAPCRAQPYRPPEAGGEDFASAFCGAVRQAASTALTVTAFLTMFSVLLALLQPVLSLCPYGAMLTGLVELTCGLQTLSSLPLTAGARLTLASFLLGFGGLAVQFQVRAIAAPCALPMRGFVSAKLLHGALAAAITAALFRISPRALAVSVPCIASGTPISGWAGIVFLILLSGFQFGLEKRRKMRYNGHDNIRLE
ncbi:MAG: hypothetical protein ACOYIE_01155 [Agathobaculum sp.]|jgi:sporulation integral membrane protein YlbJ|uniref:hypothetical protein n=1 Tax=Agathobaculum sp. TaxID=2048138 RepID=UPI003D932426